MSKEKNIYQRLNAVMHDVQYIKKEDKKVNGQYTFASHDAVTAALHMPLAKNGIAIIPTIAELTQDGNRTVAKIDISFVNIDNPIDKFTVTYYGYGIDSSDKGIGKAVSYAFKYALLKTFCLETGDDVERDNIEYKAPEVPKPKPSLEDINKKKGLLLSILPNEDRNMIAEYFMEMSKTYKKPINDMVYDYDEEKFHDDFINWKNYKEATMMKSKESIYTRKKTVA